MKRAVYLFLFACSGASAQQFLCEANTKSVYDTKLVSPSKEVFKYSFLDEIAENILVITGENGSIAVTDGTMSATGESKLIIDKSDALYTYGGHDSGNVSKHYLVIKDGKMFMKIKYIFKGVTYDEKGKYTSKIKADITSSGTCIAL